MVVLVGVRGEGCWSQGGTGIRKPFWSYHNLSMDHDKRRKPVCRWKGRGDGEGGQRETVMADDCIKEGRCTCSGLRLSRPSSIVSLSATPCVALLVDSS